ncbi:hypothetical protein JCM11641_006394, partial [Rhodosporidiobolus odoratus]
MPHSTHPSTPNPGYPSNTTTTSTTSGGGIASKIPGTAAYEATHPRSHRATGTAPGTGLGATAGGSRHTAPDVGKGGGGLASKNEHHSTHAAHVASSLGGLDPGAPGTQTTTTTTTVPKPSVGDKIGGKVETLVGRMTHNPAK